jgi:hypothetical protein
MRWRLIIEEFNPIFQYVKGIHNTVADALSRLPTGISDTNYNDESSYTMSFLAECYQVRRNQTPL